MYEVHNEIFIYLEQLIYGRGKRTKKVVRQEDTIPVEFQRVFPTIEV
jgi:hypothetical protein